MTERVSHAAFPSDETLAAFIDGRLDPETRRRVVEHMATCPECYDVVLAANALREPATNVVPFHRRVYVLSGLAAAAAIAAVALFVSPLRERILPQRTGLAALAAAAPPQRNIEGRLSGFPYRPLKPVTRGAADEDDTSPEHLKLLSVAAQVAADAKKNPTPENLHAYGVSLLMLGKWDAAVSTLEETLRRQASEEDILKAIQKSTDVSLLSDLSAAYLARGQREGKSHDFPFAVEVAERAWNLSRTRETAWNRAIALSALGVKHRARDAWNDYLAFDADSDWSSEARRRLEENSGAPSSSAGWYPCRKNWTRAVTTLGAAQGIGEVRADLSRVASELQTNCGDASISDLGELRENAVEAAQYVRQALSGFYRQDFAAGAAAAQRASAMTTGKYPVAYGESELLRGLCLSALGDPLKASDAYREALRAFSESHDFESEAHLNAALANAQEYLGNNDDAWRFRREALRILARAPRSGYSFFDFAASSANENLFGTAQDLVDEYLAAPADASPGRLGDAHCLRAALATRTTRFDPKRELDLASKLAALVQIRGERERLEANIAFVRGMTLNDVAAIDAALSYYRLGGNPVLMSRLLYARGIAEMSRGAFRAAERDLSDSVSQAERQATAFRSDEDQLSFLGTTSDLYDAAITVRLRRRDYASAFEYADRARRFVFRSGQRGESSLSAMTSAVRSDTAVVCYSVLPNELVIWTIRNRAIRWRSVPIRSGALALLTRLAWSTRDEGASSPYLRQLSAILLPDDALTPGPQRIVFIPDKCLRGVPYASLLSGEHFLIESSVVTVAPAAMTTASRRHPVALQSIIGLNAAQSSVALRSGFAPLSAADAEVEDVARMFPVRRVLSGADATVAAFRHFAPTADVVHFAGHAVYDDRRPLRSALVLAAERDEPALLTAHDLLHMPWHPSLVVLSACSTARAVPSTIPNIAYACLFGGVPDVVATLDAVSDVNSHKFFLTFHQSLQQSRDVAAAVRMAQLAFLRSNDVALHRPSMWDLYVAFTTDFMEGYSNG